MAFDGAYPASRSACTMFDDGPSAMNDLFGVTPAGKASLHTSNGISSVCPLSNVAGARPMLHLVFSGGASGTVQALSSSVTKAPGCVASYTLPDWPWQTLKALTFPVEDAQSWAERMRVPFQQKVGRRPSAWLSSTTATPRLTATRAPMLKVWLRRGQTSGGIRQLVAAERPPRRRSTASAAR
jgi:hypothetical protein